MCADDIPVFDDSHKMMELYRRERVAYEQMRRHSDAPDGRLHQLWMSKLYKVQQEIRDELYEKTNDEMDKLSEDMNPVGGER